MPVLAEGAPDLPRESAGFDGAAGAELGAELGANFTSAWNIANMGLKSFAGTAMHEGILTAGKFFGIKFKPWEAVGLAKNAAVFGAVLSVAGVLLAIWSKFKSDEERRQKEQELQEAKEKIKAQYKENANSIYGDIMGNVRKKLAESVGKELDSVEDSLRQIADERQKKEECKASLEKLSEKIDKLCNEIETGGAV